jgi:acetyltransferase-like isoleucine patch superfamily enzyme
MIIGNNLVINSNVKANPVAGDRRTTIYVGKGATLVIGENVGISSPKIICTEKIVIENDVNIGACCDIYDSDHHSVNYVDRIINGNINVKSGAVFIRRGAWLGASVIVLKGVEIGEMAVIAAGAVVTKSVPGGELWGGNPARFIRVISEPPCKTAVAPAAV